MKLERTGLTFDVQDARMPQSTWMCESGLWLLSLAKHDCMDTGVRATQEQLPEESDSPGAK
jgi:hypothetical protein